MRIIFLGPPGAGKGTHAKTIGEKFHLAHLATGDCLRRHIRGETPLGKKAKDIIAKGELVPDKLVNELMEEEMWRSKSMYKGFILDGYPRTIQQAEALDKYCSKQKMDINAVINFQTEEKVIVARLAGRRVSPSTGRVYHVTNMPPQQEGICDDTGEKLIQRDDDKPETIKRRLSVYHKETAPLIQYYEKKKILHNVDGNLGIAELQKRIIGIFESVQAQG